jgi:histidine triad (HIT) family protein
MFMADYDSKTKDSKCIFCEIASGKIQPLGDGKFFEDEQYLAWLSPFPNTLGFAVIIPKKHYGSDVLAMPDSELEKFVIAAKKVSNILLAGFDDVGRVGLIMEGTGIDHAHIKLIPMHGTEHMKKGEWRQHHSNVNFFFERYEGYICSNDGPKADESELRRLADKLRRLN